MRADREIKKSAAYNEAVGQALGIEGAELAGPDFSTFAPVLKLERDGEYGGGG